MNDEKFVGKIELDSKLKIIDMNYSAMSILGYLPSKPIYHDSGILCPGDLIIIVDRLIGDDDGGLTKEILKSKFQHNEYKSSNHSHNSRLNQCDLHRKDLLFLGYFEREIIDFKLINNVYDNENLEVKININNNLIYIELGIDYYNKLLKTRITYDQHETVELNMPYINAFGHMVVLDKNTGKVKFYQDRGYSRRNETISALLCGGKYQAKVAPDNIDYSELKNIFVNDVFCNDSQNSENALSEVLNRNLTQRIEDDFYGQYNGRVYNFHTVYHDNRLFLKFIDYEYLESFILALQGTKDYMQRKYLYNQKLINYGEKLNSEMPLSCAHIKCPKEEKIFNYYNRDLSKCLKMVDNYQLVFINKTSNMLAKRFIVTKYSLSQDIEINNFSEDKSSLFEYETCSVTGFVRKNTWKKSKINIIENFDRLAYDFQVLVLEKVLNTLIEVKSSKVYILSKTFIDLEEFGNLLSRDKLKPSVLNMSLEEK